MINNPTGSQASRRVFLSPPLTKPLRISGTPVVDIEASLSTAQSNLGALLVAYSPSPITRLNRNDGVVNVPPPDNETCDWGESSANDDACYIETRKATTTAATWRLSKGILDSNNRLSLFEPTALDPNTKARFTFPTFPNDEVIPAGSQLGIVIVGTFTGFASVAGTTGSVITLDTRVSKVKLPIVGGYAAAADAGLLAAETVPPVLGPMPADIAVETTSTDGIAVTYTPPTATDNEDPNPTVACDPVSGSVFAVGTTTVTCTARDAHGNISTGTFKVVVTWIDEDDGDVDGEVPPTLNLAVIGPASFNPFTPGLANDYLATLSATVTSTAADAALTVADPSEIATGHMVNGAFALPQALQAKASSPTVAGGDYAAVGGAGAPTPLLAYGGPVSSDAVTIGFRQSIGANDPLRTGSYSKTLTFTLSTTTP